MGVNYNPRIVTDGLIFYFDSANPKSFWQSNGISNAKDLSGNGISISFINNPNNNNEEKSLSFNGIDQIMDISSNFSIAGNANWTASIWFKMNEMPTSATSNNSKIFGGEVSNNWVISLSPVVSGSTAQIHMRGDDGGPLTNYIISNNEWVNFVTVGFPYNDGVYWRGKGDLYVNGVVDQLDSLLGDANGWGTKSVNRVGYDDRRLSYSNLEIGTITMYNRSLSYAEVHQNFNALRGRYGI